MSETALKTYSSKFISTFEGNSEKLNAGNETNKSSFCKELMPEQEGFSYTTLLTYFWLGVLADSGSEPEICSKLSFGSGD